MNYILLACTSSSRRSYYILEIERCSRIRWALMYTCGVFGCGTAALQGLEEGARHGHRAVLRELPVLEAVR